MAKKKKRLKARPDFTKKDADMLFVMTAKRFFPQQHTETSSYTT